MFFRKIIGDPNQRYLRKIRSLIDRINFLESGLKELSLNNLSQAGIKLKDRIQKGESPDDLLPEAFALVREASFRTLRQRHFDCQLQAGIALHQGKVIEMKTGEGKTLAATAPVFLNALTGKGVHVVTVNDYLARRDSVWMGQIYHLLGLKVGVLNHEQSFIYNPDFSQVEKKDEIRDQKGSFMVVHDFLQPCSRTEAYQADITYGTNNEFGFDYLRDNLTFRLDDKVQRKFNYAVIDEVDSILIDEARTPLIISQPETMKPEEYVSFARLAERLKENEDYNVDRKMKFVSLIDAGINQAEKAFGVSNLYHPENIEYLHRTMNALRAKELFLKDVDYLIKEGEVIIIDEFTGRLMPGRRYSDGIHQAIEAKEGVAIKPESKTLATITLQNLFRMYPKLSGMTGTGISAAEEFDKVYGLDVKAIPTHQTMIRQDLSDKVYGKEEAKFKAVAATIKERHQTGQPILVGTTSVEANEYLERILGREGIPCQVLNAKHHEQEAQVIAQAGRKGQVTVATNMAGRGVDIILGGNPCNEDERKEVINLGGLFVLGTERHEARRIDDQLRGRAGRQGEPGASQFFLSLKNEIFPKSKNIVKYFGGERIEKMMERFNLPEDEPIEHGLISKAIEAAQRKVEGMNFDIRKRLCDYDDVLNKHRQVVYRRRDRILEMFGQKDWAARWHELIDQVLSEEFDRIVTAHTAGAIEDWNLEEIAERARIILPNGEGIHQKLVELSQKEKLVAPELMKEYLRNLGGEIYGKLEKETDPVHWNALGKMLCLKFLDDLWSRHLTEMEELRQSVGLRAYAQREPLVEYQNEGYRMFSDFMIRWKSSLANSIFRVKININ
jgi:preprotein translocase subunit SecA